MRFPLRFSSRWCGYASGLLALLSTPAQAQQPVPFGPAVAYPLQHGGYHLLLADVAGNGHLGVVVPDRDHDSVSVLPGQAGGLGAARRYRACHSPEGLAAADLNDDGRPDLVVSGYGADSVAVLLSRPGGDFGPAGRYAVRGTPSVGLADVSGDGRPDIVTLGLEGLVLLPGQAGGRFGLPLKTGEETQPDGLLLVDVNADGRPDIVGAHRYLVSVRLGLGSSTFGAAVEYPAPDGAATLAVGDVNGDGRPDLVSANQQAHSVSVWLGLGGGTFGGRRDYPAGPDPRGVALGDVTGDSYPDILTTSYEQAAALLLPGLGGGSFGPAQTFALGTRPFAVALGDVTGDGCLDVVTANTRARSAVTVLPGLLPPAPAGPRRPPAPGVEVVSTRVALLGSQPASGVPGTPLILTGTNLTGATRVVFAGSAVPQTTGLRVNDAGTVLSGVVVPDGAATGPLVVSTPTGLTTSTFSFGVPPALHVLSHQPGPNAGAVPTGLRELTLEFDQPPTAASLATVVVLGSAAGGRRALGPATVRGNAAVLPLLGGPFRAGERVQVSVPATVQGAGGVAAASHTFTFTIATAPSSGKFRAPTNYSLGSSLQTLAVGDVTGDGRLDIVAVDYGQSRGDVSANDNPLGFGSVLFALRRQPKAKDVGTVFVLPGTKSGFGSAKSYPVGRFPNGVALADLNLDGRPDIVANSTGFGHEGQFFTLLSEVASGFSSAVGAGISSRSTDLLRLADVNGDGLPDVVASSGFSGNGMDVTVSLRQAAGFAEPATYLTARHYAAGTLALHDMNLDGYLDAIVTDAEDSTVSVLPGRPAGRFGAAATQAGAGRAAAVGDVNHDGYPDLVGFRGRGVAVQLGGPAGLGAPQFAATAPSNLHNPVLADVNGDGYFDLIASHFIENYYPITTPAPGYVVVWLGGAGGTFAAPTRYPAGTTHAYLLAVADLNDDGRLDIALLHHDGPGHVAVLLGLP